MKIEEKETPKKKPPPMKALEVEREAGKANVVQGKKSGELMERKKKCR